MTIEYRGTGHTFVKAVTIFAAAFTGSALSIGCGASSGAVATNTAEVADATATEAGLSCPAGQVLCGDTCVTEASDPANCGKCGDACTAGQVCSQGSCATSCGGGTTQCGQSCIETTIDPANCGKCGNACATGQVCSSGQCAAMCATRQTLCGVDAGAAYCADESTDNSNCGGCGIVCGPQQVCSNSACASSCVAGQTLCTPDGGAAYCANESTDNRNCGGCGIACGPQQVCSNSACASSCVAGQTLCTPDGGAAYCANESADNSNCGGCGIACGPQQVCSNSACASSCVAGQTLCTPDGGAAYCADESSDSNNCGGCGMTCTKGEACVNGGCHPLALSPQTVNGSFTNCHTSNSFAGRKAAVSDGLDLAVAMICGSVGVVAVSSDGGASFSAPVQLPFSSVSELAIEGGPGQTLYAAAESGSELVFASSTNAGATWSAVTALSTAAGEPYGPSIAHFGSQVYVQDVESSTGMVTLFINASAGVGAFTSKAPGNPAVPNDVLVDVSGDVWSVGDDGTLYLVESTNQGGTFGTLTQNTALTDFFTDWALGGASIFQVGDENSPTKLNRFPLASLGAPVTVTGLPTNITVEERAVSADTAGNAYVADQLSTGAVVLNQLPAGASALATQRTLATSGSAPGLKALPDNQVLVVYTSGTSVIASVQQY